MAPAKTYEFLVRDDATRQAMRELWQHVDSISVVNVFVSTSSTFGLIVNASYNSTTGVWTQVDTTKPSWAAEANSSSDWVRIVRAPSGSSVIAWVNQALWESTGLTLPLNLTISSLTATHVLFSGTAGLVSGDAGLTYNATTNVLTITSGYLIAPTVGVDADSQHTLPNVAADTFALLAATQTLAAKTLTSPHMGTSVILDAAGGNYTFTWANPAAARAISIIDPGGTDVFVWRDAAQTLLNKTLTSPVINTPTGNVVTGFSKSGSTVLVGAVTLSEGTNITLTQVGQDIAIAASGGTSPGGSDTQVQFNDAGAFQGDAGLVYDKTLNVLSIVGGYLIAPTVGVDADSQHILPNVAADTIVLLAATQTLSAKTLTSPVINTPTGNVVTAFSKSGDTLLVGAVTISAGTNVTLTQTGQDISIAATAGAGTPGGSDTQVQFNNSGAFGGDAGLVYNFTTNVLSIVGGFLVAPTVGPNTGQQHTLPAVASDTVVLLAATQTLAAKTLTTPIIADFTNANHAHTSTATGGLLGLQAWKRLYANTVSGAAVTSWDVTTGLAGDTDRIYYIFVYVVENATNNVIGMRFNNDSTGTYGDQDVTGSGTTAAAARATGATRFPFSFLNAAGARMWCTAVVAAISGFERVIQAQIMDQQVTMVAGTTITKTGARTGMWNNTASEINRITVFSSIASGIGIGSRLEIWGTAAI